MILKKSSVTHVNLDFEINNKIISGKLDELLLIVPTNRKIRSLKKEIISFAPGQATGKLNIETLSTFSTRLLLEQRGGNPRILSDALSSVLLRQCFQETSLSYFSYYKKDIPTGTLNRIRNVISEYKKHGISPSRLNDEAVRLTGSEKIKALDIAALYKKYVNKCRDMNLYETGDIYSDLVTAGIDRFGASFREVYPEVNLVVVMGFDEFTSLEVDLIDFTSDQYGVELFLSFDYYQYNPQVFSHLDKCYNILMGRGFTTAEDRSPGEKAKLHSIIRKSFFHSQKINQSSSFIYDLTKISALTREKEIELIVKEIKELILEGTEPASICVAFNLIGKYSPLIRDRFSLYGIPFNLTDRFPLNTSQPVISILNFLEIVENDFYYKNIFRALSSGFIRHKGVDISNLHKVSVKLKIISGYLNWKEQIQDAINQLDDAADNELSSRNLNKEAYTRAYEDIKKLHNLLSPFTRKLTLAEYSIHFNEIIFSLDVPSVLIHSSGNQTEENIKAVTTFIETVNELLELLELEYGKNSKFPLKFYLNNIRTAIVSTRYNIKEKPGYGVQVTTLNEIRGLKFDYLFIAGLTDGDFPTRFAPEIFFSGSFARGEYSHSVEERYLFYQALCSWSKRLYFSVPKQEETRELSESIYIGEFQKLFKIQAKDERDYTSKIYSKDELMAEVGKNGIKVAGCYPQVVNLIKPERLKKGLDISELRVDQQTQSEYMGNLGESLNVELTEKLHEYRQRQFSISQLETYAKCPFQFFMKRVLGLDTIEEPSEEIAAIEMGSLLHVILFEFYSQIKERGIDLSKAGQEEFSFAENLIFQIAHKKLEEAGFRSKLAFYEKEKLLGINKNRRNSLLYKFLLYERDRAEGFTPEFFEKSFGNINSENAVNIEAGGIFVRGKIDRIDLNKKDKTFRVIDYKLGGKKPSNREIDEGISLQLPLYLYAARELIKQELSEEFSPIGAAIYSLKFSEKDFGRKDIAIKNIDPVTEGLESRELTVIEKCIAAINHYVDGITSGKFNLSVLPDRYSVVCGFCEFKGVCRVKDYE